MRLPIAACLLVTAFSGFTLQAQEPAEASAPRGAAVSAPDRFKELTAKQQQRQRGMPRGREEREAAMKGMATERATDLVAFLKDFATGPESLKARFELAQLGAQYKDELGAQGKAALQGFDAKDADFKTTLQAAGLANGLELADLKAQWLALAVKRATTREDRVGLATAYRVSLKDPEKSDAVMAELEKEAKTDEEKAAVVMEKATIARRASPREDKTAYLAVLADLQKRYPATKVGAMAASKIAAGQLKIGSDPVAFTTKDLDGKSVSPADFKGKVLLIDFWATWCGPCMAELPNVLAAYGKHHDAGFEILGISLDRDTDRAKLDQVIKEKGMSWRHVYDGKYWQAEVAQMHDVNAIPFTLLIGKDGKVAGMNLRGEALEKAVGEALAK